MFANDLEKLSKRSDVKFNCDDILSLCEHMIRDHRYIEAYCYIQATNDHYSQLIVNGERNNFQTAHKISKMLGMTLCVFAEVTIEKK